MSPSASSVSIKEALLTFLFILLMAIVALSNLVPPSVVPASAPVTEFSAERVSGGLVALTWWTLQALLLVNKSFLSAYNATPYGVAFVALTASITSALFVWFRQRVDAGFAGSMAFL